MKPWQIALAGFALLAWFGSSPLNLEFLLVGGVPILFLGTGLLALFGAVTAYRRSRYVQDLPTSHVGSAATGLVEITGTVRPAGRTIESPFENRDCVLCQYTVREPPPPEGSSQPSMLPLDYGVVGVPFYVEDDTGRILVRPDGADIRLPQNILELDGSVQSTSVEKLEDTPRITYGRARADQAPLDRFETSRSSWYDRFGLTDRMVGLVALLEKLGSGDRHRDFPDGPLQFGEARLEPGDQVYVLGHARPRDSDLSAEEEAPPNAERVLSASPGRTNPSNPIGRYLAHLLSVRDYLRLGSEHRSMFLISSKPEESLIDRWRGRITTQLVAGFLVFGLGLLAGWFALGYLRLGP